MKKTEHSFTKNATTGEDEIKVAELVRYIEDWLLDGDIRGFSARTTESRRIFVGKFIKFLPERNDTVCDPSELRQFFHHLNRAHSESGGRWGNPQFTRALRPATVQT